MYKHTAYNIVTFDLPDEVSCSSAYPGILELTPVQGYLPRATIVYMPVRLDTLTRDVVRTDIAKRFSGATEICMERYREKSATFVLQGFATRLSHSKYAALWGGEMVYLSSIVRLQHEEMTWSFTIKVQVPTGDAERFIPIFHSVLMTAALSPEAAATYTNLTDERH